MTVIVFISMVHVVQVKHLYIRLSILLFYLLFYILFYISIYYLAKIQNKQIYTIAFTGIAATLSNRKNSS